MVLVSLLSSLLLFRLRLVNLSFKAAVGLVMRVIFPNSRKVLFEKFEAERCVSRTPKPLLLLIPSFRKTSLPFRTFFARKLGWPWSFSRFGACRTLCRAAACPRFRSWIFSCLYSGAARGAFVLSSPNSEICHEFFWQLGIRAYRTKGNSQYGKNRNKRSNRTVCCRRYTRRNHHSHRARLHRREANRADQRTAKEDQINTRRLSSGHGWSACLWPRDC